MDKPDEESEEYCSAEDGSWSIRLWRKAKYTEAGEWVDCWHVTVPLQDGIASPWFPDATYVSVGATFDTYEEAFAHVSRPDLMLWALTVHAQSLSHEIVQWRRRAADQEKHIAQLTEWNNKQGDMLRRHLPDLFPSPKHAYRLPDFCKKDDQ